MNSMPNGTKLIIEHHYLSDYVHEIGLNQELTIPTTFSVFDNSLYKVKFDGNTSMPHYFDNMFIKSYTYRYSFWITFHIPVPGAGVLDYLRSIINKEINFLINTSNLYIHGTGIFLNSEEIWSGESVDYSFIQFISEIRTLEIAVTLEE